MNVLLSKTFLQRRNSLFALLHLGSPNIMSFNYTGILFSERRKLLDNFPCSSLSALYISHDVFKSFKRVGGINSSTRLHVRKMHCRVSSNSVMNVSSGVRGKNSFNPMRKTFGFSVHPSLKCPIHLLYQRNIVRNHCPRWQNLTSSNFTRH